MTCMRIGSAIVCVADTDVVTMANGRKLQLEWHPYMGPSVGLKNGGMRLLRPSEFDDPNVKAWIEKKSNQTRKATP